MFRVRAERRRSAPVGRTTAADAAGAGVRHAGDLHEAEARRPRAPAGVTAGRPTRASRLDSPRRSRTSGRDLAHAPVTTIEPSGASAARWQAPKPQVGSTSSATKPPLPNRGRARRPASGRRREARDAGLGLVGAGADDDEPAVGPAQDWRGVKTPPGTAMRAMPPRPKDGSSEPSARRRTTRQVVVRDDHAPPSGSATARLTAVASRSGARELRRDGMDDAAGRRRGLRGRAGVAMRTSAREERTARAPVMPRRSSCCRTP